MAWRSSRNVARSSGQHYFPGGQHYIPTHTPGQQWLFIHVTWRVLDQSRSRSSDGDITIHNSDSQPQMDRDRFRNVSNLDLVKPNWTELGTQYMPALDCYVLTFWHWKCCIHALTAGWCEMYVWFTLILVTGHWFLGAWKVIIDLTLCRLSDVHMYTESVAQERWLEKVWF